MKNHSSFIKQEYSACFYLKLKFLLKTKVYHYKKKMFKNNQLILESVSEENKEKNSIFFLDL